MFFAAMHVMPLQSVYRKYGFPEDGLQRKARLSRPLSGFIQLRCKTLGRKSVVCDPLDKTGKIFTMTSRHSC